MKVGEYSLHVLVQSTSSLSLDHEKDLDVLISINAFGDLQYSKVKKDVGVQDTFWGEHFYFQKIFNNSIEVSSQRITLSVFDHALIASDSLIGSYDIDVLKVYEEEEHKMEHFWCGLINVEKDFSVITGYIKVSVCVIGEGDKNQQLPVQPIASITADRKILLPPMIERKNYQITAQIMQAINLSPIDGESVDSYIALQYGQNFVNTEPIARNCNPKFHTRLFLPIDIPAAVNNIVIRINDFNFVQRTQVIGSHYFNIDSLLRNYIGPKTHPNQSHLTKHFQFLGSNMQWINIYGPQKKAKKKQHKNIHQFFPQLATSYVGSVLMRVMAEESGDSEKKSEKIEDDQIEDLMKVFASYVPVFYRLTVRITAALNLYRKNKQYKIIIQVGSLEFGTDYSKSQNGFCVWNTEISDTIKVYSNQIVPDIYVYLVDYKGQKVCYTRLPASDDLRAPILEDKWINLKPDFSMVDYTLEEAGYLKIGIKMKREDKYRAVQIKKIKNQMSSLKEKNEKKSQIFIELISAHSLIPLDEDGSSDPFFNFSFMNAEVSSSLKNDTLNPNYLEVITLQTDLPDDEQSYPPIIVNAYDKDKMSKQLIGTTFLDIGDLVKGKALSYGSFRSKPKQFALKQNDTVCGFFTASFTIMKNPIKNLKPQINLPCKRYKLILVALGLRGLKPSSALPVKRPYIEFDFQSLSKYHEKNSHLNVRTLQIEHSGTDIRIYKPLIQSIYLPEDINYWPVLSAVVKNGGIGKIYKSVLGYCSMNLKEAYAKSLNFKEILESRNRNMVKKKGIIERKSQRLNCLSNKSILALRNFIHKASNYKWKILNDKMVLNSLQNADISDNNNRKNRQLNSEYIVLFPHYVKIEGQDSMDENKKRKLEILDKFKGKIQKVKVKAPHYSEKYKSFILSNQEYMAIGYDGNEKRSRNLNDRERHYRFILNRSLEEYHKWAYGTELSLVGETEIRRGRKSINSEDPLSSFIRKISTEDMKSGLFKADMLVIEDSSINSSTLSKQSLFIEQTKSLVQRVMKKEKIKLFLYIIDARNLPSRDTFNQNDSYIVVKVGSQKIDFSDNTIKDTLNPRFNQKVKLDLEFPKDSMLQIQVWDNDPMKRDELIGSVFIDLENRLQTQILNESWNNPIETHDIMFPTSKISKGMLRFWMDFVPAQMLFLYKEFDIRDKPPSQYEIRLIVWSVEGMPNNDIQDMSDLYVSCQFGEETQETDVHYRTQNGEGNFNWRMKFPVTMPAKDYRVALKVYDKDIFSRNEYLASCSFSIEAYLQQVFQTEASTRLFLGKEDLASKSDVKTGKSRLIEGQKRYDRFWVETENRNLEEDSTSDHERGMLRNVGRVQISIQILTSDDAKKRPAGKGRQNPNQNPYLPQPKNRMTFSLNPLKMIGQLCGQKFKTRICIGIILFILITTGIYFLSSFWGGFAGGAGGAAATN